VTNICWTADDMYVLSTGGGENSIFQWTLVPGAAPVDASLRTGGTVVPARGAVQAIASRPGGSSRSGGNAYR
jgi:hypothetical protein